MIYRRYGGNVKDILSMPFFDGYELIAYALDEEVENKLFLRWVAGYQTAMGFDEFKNQISASIKAKNDNRTEKEIYDFVLKIMR